MAASCAVSCNFLGKILRFPPNDWRAYSCPDLGQHFIRYDSSLLKSNPQLTCET